VELALADVTNYSALNSFMTTDLINLTNAKLLRLLYPAMATEGFVQSVAGAMVHHDELTSFNLIVSERHALQIWEPAVKIVEYLHLVHNCTLETFEDEVKQQRGEELLGLLKSTKKDIKSVTIQGSSFPVSRLAECFDYLAILPKLVRVDWCPESISAEEMS
jgi:hypothetical protein